MKEQSGGKTHSERLDAQELEGSLFLSGHDQAHTTIKRTKSRATLMLAWKTLSLGGVRFREESASIVKNKLPLRRRSQEAMSLPSIVLYTFSVSQLKGEGRSGCFCLLATGLVAPLTSGSLALSTHKSGESGCCGDVVENQME